MNEKFDYVEIVIGGDTEDQDATINDIRALFVGDEDFIENDILVSRGIAGQCIVSFFSKRALGKIDRLTDFLKKS